MAAELPLVAIVGRPNVGKSTLMNRILGRRVAIVEEKSGVTRDRKEVEAEWLGRPFRLVDTGGWLAGGSQLDKKVCRQSEQAIKDADVILFVVDATVGVTDEDARVADLLRAVPAPVLLVANKIDDASHEARVWDLMSLGPRRPVPGLRAARPGDRGPARLDHPSIGAFPDVEEDHELVEEVDESGAICSIALVGRPNVGKSTLFNRLIGEDRSVVHDMPGTTRDAVDTVVETDVGPAAVHRHRRDAPQVPHRRRHRVLLHGARPQGGRRGRRRPARHRRHRGHHPPGPAPGRTGRRCGLSHRGAAEQVGAARRGRAQGRAVPAGPEAALPGRLGRAADLGADRPGGAPAAARRSRTRSTPTTPASPPGRSTTSSGGPSRPSPARTAGASSTPPRARPTRRRSPSSPTRRFRPATCATSSGSCGRRSTWRPPRSSCGCVAGGTERPTLSGRSRPAPPTPQEAPR